MACNFPTWQCALFEQVAGVVVVMRFTHRWDHHLQGIARRPEPTAVPRVASAAASTPPLQVTNRTRPADTRAHQKSARILLAAEAYRTLRAMASQPRVVIAASNAYDATYLRRQLGVRATPWAGLASQLLLAIMRPSQRRKSHSTRRALPRLHRSTS